MSKLIIEKPVIGRNGWSVLKYKREVFHDNLWGTDDALMECRGKVIDDKGNTIALPLRKVFNYLENGAGADLSPDDLVEVTKKVNGSMFHATQTKEGILFGTTGSAVLGDAPTDNEFLNRGRKIFYEHVDKEAFSKFSYGMTHIFEVVDNQEDPHVVNDEDGMYLLSVRNLDGKMMGSNFVEITASLLNMHSKHLKMLSVPQSRVVRWGEVLKALKTCKHEGYMVRVWGSSDFICKVKSPYYLNKKRAQRIKPERLFSEDWRSFFDDDFYATIFEIRRSFTIDQWSAMTEQERSEMFDRVYENILTIKVLTDA